MTRNGKIARLPRTIRDELNRRLDNGEPGVQLVEWLNSLPEVKEVLDTYFEGRPINEGNVSEWKCGGFREWQERQDTMSLARDLTEEGTDFADVAPKVADAVECVALTHYAAALHCSNRDCSEKPAARLKRLSGSLRDVGRLREREQARERLEIERKWFELAERKAEAARRGKASQASEDSIAEPELTHQEKAEVLKALIFGEAKETGHEKPTH